MGIPCDLTFQLGYGHQGDLEYQQLTAGGKSSGQTQEGWESRLTLRSNEVQGPNHRNKVRS